MINASALLARSITWASSKQSYITARFLADRDRVDDCLRAYAYFRWADDMIDITLSDSADRNAFIDRQKSLVNRLYQGLQPEDLSPQENMLADLIAHDRTLDSGLRSFIINFMQVIAIDASRKGRLSSRYELASYTSCLATAVMDGIQYFIGNGHAYPRTNKRTLAVRGAHITHMLRDMLPDLSAGLINIPVEYLDVHGIADLDVKGEQFRLWVRSQVELARRCFQEGKTYIDSLTVLRCKLAGFWYCARFECILDAIQHDGYLLREEYSEHASLKTWLKIVRLGVVVTLKHFGNRIRLIFFHPEIQPN